jgi:hypothetical protein
MSPHKILIELVGGPGDGERMAIDSDVDIFMHTTPRDDRPGTADWTRPDIRTPYRKTNRLNGLGATIFEPLNPRSPTP